MPSPNVSINDLIATTIESRSGELADNITLHMPLFMRLKKRGNVTPITGGSKILEELEYAENGTVKWYSGYETLDVAPQEIFTAAEYDIRQLAGTVTTSGRELLQNDGNKEAIINLVEKKYNNLKSSLANTMARSVHSDGTGNGGKQIMGLQAFISTNPTSGTVGGINRASWSFWRNQKFSGTSDGGGAVSTANIRSYMRQLALRLVRGDDFPDLITADLNYYNLYAESLTPYQRVTGNDSFGSGFKALKFYEVGHECDVIFAGANTGMPSNTMYFQNTKYLRLRPHSRRNMTKIGDNRQPINQDAEIQIVGWAGNMTCSNMMLQGVLFA